MSRFFSAVGESDSESSEEEVQDPVRRQVVVYSSDEETVKRVVKPAKVKFLGELRSVVLQINNHKKIKDFSSLLSAFEELYKIYDKAHNAVFSTEHAPHFFVVCIAQLSDFVNAAWEDAQGRKMLSKMGYKSLAALRQKLRKFAKTFEGAISDYNNNPESYDDVDEIVKVETAPEQKTEDLTEIDSSDLGDNDSDEESEDETQYENLRDRFLKKTEPMEGEFKKKDRKEKKTKEIKHFDDGEGEWEMVTGNTGASLDQKLFAKDSDINVSSALVKLQETENLRRLKRVERLHRIHLLHELSKITDKHQLGAGLKAKVLIAEISSLFECNGSALDPMKPEHWDNVLDYISQLIMVLADGNIKIGEHMNEDDENVQSEPYKIRCHLSGLLARLIAEFHKVLKSLDPFKNDFREKFASDQKIGAIIDKILLFCRKNCEVAETSQVMLLKIEHIYYKVDLNVFDENYLEKTSLDEIDELSKYIIANNATLRISTRAILAKIYHLALHNKWTAARDLFLMSHLQNQIEKADPSTQILYNRALAQLGLSAFRNGHFTDAQNCLTDLVTSGRIRELLGQGFSIGRNVERTHEQELRERQFQTPFHMTINLDLIDATYLITAMLIDIPILAAGEHENRRKLISKHFYLQLRMIERLNLVGPPESLREHVIAASGALKSADWRKCCGFIINPKMKKKVWDLVAQPFSPESLLETEIKKQCLKTYIYSYNMVYESISISHLANMFELSVFQVESIISAMILNEGLCATINGPHDCLVFQKKSSKTALQIAGCHLMEKLTTLVDCNERLVPDKNLRNNSRGVRFGVF